MGARRVRQAADQVWGLPEQGVHPCHGRCRRMPSAWRGSCSAKRCKSSTAGSWFTTAWRASKALAPCPRVVATATSIWDSERPGGREDQREVERSSSRAASNPKTECSIGDPRRSRSACARTSPPETCCGWSRSNRKRASSIIRGARSCESVGRSPGRCLRLRCREIHRTRNGRARSSTQRRSTDSRGGCAAPSGSIVHYDQIIRVAEMSSVVATLLGRSIVELST